VVVTAIAARVGLWEGWTRSDPLQLLVRMVSVSKVSKFPVQRKYPPKAGYFTLHLGLCARMKRACRHVLDTLPTS
jgi:hypothetical protein